MIKILAFGMIAGVTGATELYAAGITDSKALEVWLQQKFPGLKEVKYSIAVNRKLIQGMVTLQPGDEAALLPPFSGG